MRPLCEVPSLFRCSPTRAVKDRETLKSGAGTVRSEQGGVSCQPCQEVGEGVTLDKLGRYQSVGAKKTRISPGNRPEGAIEKGAQGEYVRSP